MLRPSTRRAALFAAFALVVPVLTALAPNAEATTTVSVYLLVRWDGLGCVGTGTGTSINLVARDMWQASGTVTASWPGTNSATRCVGDTYGGLVQAGPVYLIKYDGYHTYRLEASITDASGTVTSYSSNQAMRVGGSCTGSTYYMGTNDVYCSSSQPASNYLGRANAQPSTPTVQSLYPDYSDPQHTLYLYWNGPSTEPFDFNAWEVHMSTTSGFTPSYSFPSTLIATRSYASSSMTVTGLQAGTQYCFKIRNTDLYWKYSDYTYRNYPSFGESAEKCANTQGGTLTVTSPNGGEAWSHTHAITWTGGSPSFTVSRSADAGASYTDLAANVGSRSWSWNTTTGPDGADYFVRVSDGTASDASDARFTVDNTPPVTSEAQAPASPDCNGWYHASPTFTLTATDNLAGVRTTHWSAGGGSTVYGGPFTLPGDGTWSLRYWSDDRADPANVEDPHHLSVRVDGTPPTTTLRIGAPHYDGGQGVTYVTSGTRLELDATDAASGVNRTEYRIDGGAWSAYSAPFNLSPPDGPHVVEYRSVDEACNVESAHARRVFVDDTAPVVNVTRPRPGAAYVGDTEVGLLADVLSRLPALPVSADSVCAAIDRAVKVAEQDGAPVGVTGPVIETLCGSSRGTVVMGNVTVDADATDPVVNGGASGMDHVEFWVDGAHRADANVTPYTWTWDTSRDPPGPHVLSVRGVDHLDHVGYVNETVIVVSATPPAAPALPEPLATLVEQILYIIGPPVGR